MLIDWFTVVAQAINFLILVWLMKRYLYQPILKALDAREQRIAAELADADAKKAEALAEREEFRRKNEEFDQQRAGLLSKATNDAAAEHSRLLDEVRKDADDLRGKLQDKLGNEFRNLHDEIGRRTQAEVFAIARKTLSELSGTSLEQRMAEVFVQRLRELGDSERSKLASHCGTGHRSPCAARSNCRSRSEHLSKKPSGATLGKKNPGSIRDRAQPDRRHRTDPARPESRMEYLRSSGVAGK